MSALNTDLYELTMAAGYFAAGKADEIATFELRSGDCRKIEIFWSRQVCGRLIEYLQNLSFHPEEIDYLRALAQFQNAPPSSSSSSWDCVSQGTCLPCLKVPRYFPNEPIAIIRAPIIQAQMVETYLLSTFAFQTSIASKAARCVIAAEGGR